MFRNRYAVRVVEDRSELSGKAFKGLPTAVTKAEMTGRKYGQCLRRRRRTAADFAPCQRLARWTEVGSTVVNRATI